MTGVDKFKIKMFADGADLSSIQELLMNPLVAGFTTNPTLMKKAGIANYRHFAKEVVEIVGSKPISLEVFADDIEEMRTQAFILSAMGENVYVKIPVTNTKGQSTADLVRSLSLDGVKLNVTAIFTRDQIDSFIDALTGGSPSVISIFAGRIADAGVNPIPIMEHAITSTHEIGSIEILWASPREILNLIQAEEIGCGIITMPPDLWNKIPHIGKSLDQFSLETVEMFYKDAYASGYQLQ
jgi:transaldolase